MATDCPACWRVMVDHDADDRAKCAAEPPKTRPDRAPEAGFLLSRDDVARGKAGVTSAREALRAAKVRKADWQARIAGEVNVVAEHPA